MVFTHLFYWPLEQVFLFPRPPVYRRLISLVISLALLIQAAPAAHASRRIGEIPPITAAALSDMPLFFRPLAVSSRWVVLEKLSEWTRGDRALKALRARHRRGLRHSFLMMAGDSCASLTVPFIGQALYDTAAHGAGFPGSLRTMAVVSGLLIVVEGLDPFRRYIQFRMTQASSRFVADVRTFLLTRFTLTPERPAPAGLIYLHAPSMAVRNIEFPLKMPLIVSQALLSSGLLWRASPVVALAAIFTALALGLWSHHQRQALADVNAGLRQAESDALAALENLTAGSQNLRCAGRHFQTVRSLEIRQAAQSLWYDGVVDRASTLVLMTGVMLWGAWHQYWHGAPTTGQILTLLALAWNVQHKIAAFLALVRRRLEAESSTFLLSRLSRAA